MLKVVGAASCSQEARAAGSSCVASCAALRLGPASCGSGRVDDVVLGSALSSEAGGAVLQSMLSNAHWSRTCLVACHKLLGSPFGRLDRADGVANRPNKKRPQLPVGILALGS